MPNLQLRRGADRATTRTDWLTSQHSFAFGPHYDPDNLSFGPLIACNSDIVQPGVGYPVHRHAGIEILTWVLSGNLLHVGGSGAADLAETVVAPGQLQYLATGAGVEHTERSASASEPVHVVQMWLAPEPSGATDTGRAGQPTGASVPPRYQVRTVGAGALVVAASGRRPAPIALDRGDAELFLVRPAPGEFVELPDAALRHAFVLAGTVRVSGPQLDEVQLGVEDAVRISGTGPVVLSAAVSAGTADAAGASSELLVWSFEAQPSH